MGTHETPTPRPPLRTRRWSRKRVLLAVLSVLVSGGLLMNLLAQLDPQQAFGLFRRAHAAPLVLAILASLTLPLCAVLRWKGVLVAQHLKGLSFLTALRAVLMAFVLNSLLPSKGGDMAKAFYVRKHANLSVGLGTVVLERLVDLTMLGLLGLVGYLWSGAGWGLVAAVTLLGGVGLVFLLALGVPVRRLSLPEKVSTVLEDVRSVFRRWVRSPLGMLMTLTGSFLNWSLAAFSVCALLVAFDAPVSWAYAYGVFPLAILAGLFPLTISGVGTRDSAFVALFMAANVSRETATLVGVGYTLCAYWLLSFVSLPVVFWQLKEYFARADVEEKD